MKKTIVLLLTAVLTFCLTACNVNSDESTSSNAVQGSGGSVSTSLPDSTQEFSSDQSISSQQSTGENRILVAYFSWADNAVTEDDVDALTSPSVVAPGHVAQLASWIQEETGGDLFSIQVTEPYSSDWDECLDRANQERSENARLELTQNVENIESYDTIFLGYPNWWYGAPMALLSFIEQNDLSGKQVYLFCSHGTGGLAGSVDDIAEVLPESAQLSENVFDVYEEDASSSENEILNWLQELGY